MPILGKETAHLGLSNPSILSIQRFGTIAKRSEIPSSLECTPRRLPHFLPDVREIWNCMRNQCTYSFHRLCPKWARLVAYRHWPLTIVSTPPPLLVCKGLPRWVLEMKQLITVCPYQIWNHFHVWNFDGGTCIGGFVSQCRYDCDFAMKSSHRNVWFSQTRKQCSWMATISGTNGWGVFCQPAPMGSQLWTTLTTFTTRRPLPRCSFATQSQKLLGGSILRIG